MTGPESSTRAVHVPRPRDRGVAADPVVLGQAGPIGSVPPLPGATSTAIRWRPVARASGAAGTDHAPSSSPSSVCSVTSRAPAITSPAGATDDASGKR